MSYLALFVVLLAALPGFAVDLEQNDVVTFDINNSALIHIDANTGDRTVLSGCADSSCTSTIGSGPELLGNAGSTVGIRPDSTIVVLSKATAGPFAGCITLISADPASGNRQVISAWTDPSTEDPCAELGTGIAVSQGGLAVVGPFAASVAALPSWGLAVAAGVLLGLSMRSRRGAETARARLEDREQR